MLCMYLLCLTFGMYICLNVGLAVAIYLAAHLTLHTETVQLGKIANKSVCLLLLCLQIGRVLCTTIKILETVIHII